MTDAIARAWNDLPAQLRAHPGIKALHCAALAAPQQAPSVPAGWKPIETAPKDGTRVLIACSHGIYAAEYEDREIEWWHVTDNKRDPMPLRGAAPTHWMPLPAAPGAAPQPAAAQEPADGLRTQLQLWCSQRGLYWRAGDDHGVTLTREQATDLLIDALGVGVEIDDGATHLAAQAEPQPVALVVDHCCASTGVVSHEPPNLSDKAPARVALPADLIEYLRKHLKHQRDLIAGFEALGNEVRRAAKLDGWIAAVDGIQAGTDGGQDHG